MDPTTAFPLCLGLTVLLLGLVVATGVAGRIPIHLPLVVLALVSLGVTIYFAEKLGNLYDLAAAGAITPVHLFVAKVATCAYLLPIVTGVMTLRDRRYRRLHFWMAMLVIVLTLCTAATGTWMICLAPRKA